MSVLPLSGKTPAVAWRAYQQQRASPPELRRWARRGLFGNVGIVCGRVSGNLVVLDFDTPDAFDSFRVRFPNLTQTYTVATGGGGWHVYLRVDSLPPSRRGQGVDLCAGGRQVVAPPSIHPASGRPYRVALPLEIHRVPDLSDVVVWLESTGLSRKMPGPATARELPVRWTASTALIAAISNTLRTRSYQQKGDWLSGPCVYPHRHVHDDSKTSFGFNMHTGYGNCFVCGSMLAKDVARAIGLSAFRKEENHARQEK